MSNGISRHTDIAARAIGELETVAESLKRISHQINKADRAHAELRNVVAGIDRFLDRLTISPDDSSQG